MVLSSSQLQTLALYSSVVLSFDIFSMVLASPISVLHPKKMETKPLSPLNLPYCKHTTLPLTSRVRLTAHTNHYVTLKSLKQTFPHIVQLLDRSTPSHLKIPSRHCEVRQRKFFQQFLFPIAQCCSSSHSSDSYDSDDQLPGFLKKQHQSSSQLASVYKPDDVSTLEINKWLDQETGVHRLQGAYALR